MKKQDLSSNFDNTVIKRRPSTRVSGYQTHIGATGKNVTNEKEKCYKLKKNDTIKVTFIFDDVCIAPNNFVGFGGWFYISDAEGISYKTTNFNNSSRIIQMSNSEWSAFGSLSIKKDPNHFNVANPTITFTANRDVDIAFHNLNCGIVEHELLLKTFNEEPDQLDNIHDYVPEANFIVQPGEVLVSSSVMISEHEEALVWLKQCNRCARFLPVNIPNDNNTLSFGRHSANAKLVHTTTGEFVKTIKGFQLECRFCKKLVVNLPLNRQRNADQMKEDAARRRCIELLLEKLYGESYQLTYRAKHNGRELATDVWNRFNQECFNCGLKLPEVKCTHLDHTRPLSLLWRLDSTATCLCEGCNSQKSNKTPSEFYSKKQLGKLSKIIGVPLDELESSNVNIIAVEAIIEKLEWLMTVFCKEQNLNQIRGGKNTAELFLTALERAFERTEYKGKYNLVENYRSYNFVIE